MKRAQRAGGSGSAADDCDVLSVCYRIASLEAANVAVLKKRITRQAAREKSTLQTRGFSTDTCLLKKSLS